MRTAGLVLGTLAGSAICIFSGGIACAAGVAIVGEALALAPDQAQYSLSKELFRNQIISHEEVLLDEKERNFTLAMAPLAIVRIKGVEEIKKATQVGGYPIVKLTREVSSLKKPLTRTDIKHLIPYEATNSLQNQVWIEAAKRSSKKSLFIDIENSAMKTLNDGLGDKNLVTSLTNLHKIMVKAETTKWLKKYPELNINLYSDFKSFRIALEGNLDDAFKTKLKNEFSEILERVNEKYQKKVLTLDTDHPEILQDAQSWFKAGMGDTADQAGLAARNARATKGRASVDIDDVQEHLQKSIMNLENLRTSLSKNLPSELIDKEKAIPSIDVIEFIRKKGSLYKQDSYGFKKSFKDRFGHELNDQQAHELVNYLNGVDQFSPGLWLVKREVANLDAAEFGGFSADFKGIGAKNLQQVAIDLAKEPNKLEETIETLRKGESLVTKGFNKNKNFYRDVITKTLKEDGIKSKNICSGDDCVSLPTTALPDLTKEKIMKAMARQDRPDGQRLSFIPPGIPVKDRTLLAVHGELMEKEVRQQLTGFGDNQISPDVLKQVSFALDMPSQVGSGKAKLLISAATWSEY